QAVLFRSSHHSDVLELELARRNIPFVKYGGLKFLEAAHVKDLLALLRILENPRDEVSWFRALQLLDGVGPASARAIMAALGLHQPASGSVSAPASASAPESASVPAPMSAPASESAPALAFASPGGSPSVAPATPSAVAAALGSASAPPSPLRR